MSWTFTLPALSLLSLAAWRDIATRTIPNGVCGAVAVLGLALRATEGWYALATSVAAATLMFLVLLVCHARGFLGGGDVKLLSALALGLSPVGSWNLVVATALAGGVLALAYLAMQRLHARCMPLPVRAAHNTLQRVLAVEAWRIRRRGPMPYGVAIAIGAAIVLLQAQEG
ncbi:MAG: prepilin peptidase [Rhodospirillales bacterium]|jgi:prepilin peptidase CpaA|nr:prepilin peptidase [Rhodospirillales bacterium]